MGTTSNASPKSGRRRRSSTTATCRSPSSWVSSSCRRTRHMTAQKPPRSITRREVPRLPGTDLDPRRLRAARKDLRRPLRRQRRGSFCRRRPSPEAARDSGRSEGLDVEQMKDDLVRLFRQRNPKLRIKGLPEVRHGSFASATRSISRRLTSSVSHSQTTTTR